MAILSTLLLAVTGTALAAGRSPLVLPRCAIEDVAGDVRCGTIDVPEDRTARRGRRVPLYTVVLKSAGSGGSTREAFFVIQGGPGQAAAPLADFYGRLLARVRQSRDVVLVDVRGTGGSNALTCDLHAKGPPSADVLPLDAVKRCRAELEARADLRQYTTSNIVADLEEARRALGYDRIHLYGTSYGTRVALEYLRRHPSRVKTITLKGTVSPSTTAPVTFGADAHGALERVLARCETDPRCANAFPRLRADVSRVLERLRAAPARVLVPDAQGPGREVLITADLFGEALRNMLYSPESIARVPLLLTQAAAGDLSEAARLVDRTQKIFSGGIAVGMFLSVTCAEDIPFIEERRVEPAAVFGDFRLRQQRGACSVWPRGAAPADFHAPVLSDRPVLILSGELDPVTPARLGSEVAGSLPNALHVVVPHNGHPMGPLLPCAGDLIADLVSRGKTAGLDTSCAQGLKPVPFVMPAAADPSPP